MTSKSQKSKASGKSGKKASKPVSKKTSYWIYLGPVLAYTFLLFLPALKNGFTNWDDTLYVTQNNLLKSFNAESLKAIFSTPIVSNYHPLTILSLALNYQIAGLEPLTYILTNILLHVANTGLVFWLIYRLTSGNVKAGALTALLFGTHPMHVESVVWISERKDLLYTLFYLCSMMVYIKYVRLKENKWLLYATLLGACSLLSKPAAIVLPLSWILLDYFLKRQWSVNWILEKIPMLIMSLAMVYITLATQAERAIASTELYTLVERIFFAGFGWCWYLIKIIAPYPLSALHPFPKDLTAWYYIATAAAIAFVIYALWKIRNREFLFGFGFYTVNLLLVLQLVSIGNAVVAERYTYVPYIGIFFWLSVELFKRLDSNWVKYKNATYGVLAIAVLAFSGLTLQRIPDWRASQVLWEDVLSHYPQSARAWTNKGLDFYDQKKYAEVITHLTHALEGDSTYADALEWRARTYLEMGDGQKALEDVLRFQRVKPNSEAMLFLLARAYAATNQDQNAVNVYTKLIDSYNKPEYYNNRGVIFFNKLQQYENARKDFDHAIELNPKDGSTYLNLSRCYYMLGDQNNARSFAVKAIQLGQTVDTGYRQAIGLD